MKAQELMIDNTANNLANVNTNGFKKSQMDFADLMYVTLRQAGTEVASGLQSPIGLQIGSGVRPVGTTKLFTPGVFEQTTNPTDMAIEGDGFFKVTLPSGDFRYTRDGAFHKDGQGNIVNGDGYLLDGAPSIDIGISNIRIGTDGTVSGTDSQGNVTQLGQIQLARFLNPSGLSSEGGNLYSITPASGPEEQGTPGENGFGAIRQSFLERSNVEVVTELVSLITAQRAYEINSRAVRAGDEMLSTTADIVR